MSDFPNNDNATTQVLAWCHFIFDIPASWEITRYSVNEKKGRLELNSRERYEGRISWEVCSGIPDQERILNEFHRRYLKEHHRDRFINFSGLQTENIAGFTVAHGEAGDPVQAVSYREDSKVLLVWTFPEYHPEVIPMARKILASFRNNQGEHREWSAWGHHFQLPKRFTPTSVSAMPANVSMTFEDEDYYRLDFHRWGLPTEVMQGRSLKDFYHLFLKRSECKVTAIEEDVPLFGHHGIEAKYRQRGRYDMDFLYGRWWDGEGVCWHNEEEMRIYGFEQIGKRKLPKLDRSEIFVY